MIYTEPDKLFAISGKDSLTGDVIVKIVNAYGNEMPVNISLNHGVVNSSTAKLITLSSINLSDENSFDESKKFVPVNAAVQANKNQLSLTLKSYSINILRAKID
jgi:alpha-L-arabinofuranosidase